MLPGRASERYPVVQSVGAENLRGWHKRTFSTSPRAYICLAVRLDVQMGSISNGSDGLLATPSALDVMVARDNDEWPHLTLGVQERENMCIATSTQNTKTRPEKVTTILLTRSPPSLHISQWPKWIRWHRHGRIDTPTPALPARFSDYSAMYRLECFCPFL